PASTPTDSYWRWTTVTPRRSQCSCGARRAPRARALLLGPAAPATGLRCARRIGPRDREARTIARDRRGLRDRLALGIDHRDRLRAESREGHRLAISDRARSAELHCAELVERDEAAADAGRLLDPLRRRGRGGVLNGHAVGAAGGGVLHRDEPVGTA